MKLWKISSYFRLFVSFDEPVILKKDKTNLNADIPVSLQIDNDHDANTTQIDGHEFSADLNIA